MTGTTPDFHAMRVKMVDGQVRTTDVTDAHIISALLEVPREEFVPAARRSIAYIDEDLQISPPAGGRPARYLMEASPFAKLLQLAGLQATDVVLDVGCGAGYSAAVLSRMVGSVIALEEDEQLAAQASSTLSKLGFDNVAVVQGPMREGHKREAPYDAIIIEGAVEELPAALFEQLRDGGRLVAVEGHGNAGVARRHVKDRGTLAALRGFNAAIRPLPGFERAETFQF